jgi:hypothetical protein
MLADQQQRLLAAHAATDRIDTAPIDPEPWHRRLKDRRHAG